MMQYDIARLLFVMTYIDNFCTVSFTGTDPGINQGGWLAKVSGWDFHIL